MLYIFSILELLGFLIYSSPVILGAYSLARYLSKGGRFEIITLTFCISFLEIIVIFGILGIFGGLNLPMTFVSNFIIGGALCYFFRSSAKSSFSPVQPFNLSERILLIIFFVGMLRCLYGTTIQSGTDTYLYHFFYPAKWITDGHISREPLLGHLYEYYPIYGEVLYGWMMIPFNNSSIAIFLQLISILAAGSAFLMLGELFGFKRAACLAALNIMFYTSLISVNSIMGYTDVLNGAFLVLGFSLMLLGMMRNSSGISVLAGLILGVSASIKLIGLMLTPLLTVFFSVVFFCMKKKFRKNIILLDVSAFLAASPCYLLNWIDTGNPFYPVKISIAGMDIFPKGLVFERAAAGLGNASLGMFFSEGIWGLNYASIIFYGLLPFMVLGFVVFAKKIKLSGYPLISLAVAAICLFLVQIHFYPALAGARQFIPLIMLCSLLIIPLTDRIRENVFPFCALAVLLICIALNFTSLQKTIQTVVILFFPIVLLSFLPEKIFKKVFLLICLLLIFYIPYCFTISLEAKRVCYKYLMGASAAKCFDIVFEDYEKGKKVKIASVGGWYNYMFLECMPGNKVCYIPVNSINSVHVHDFNSFEEMGRHPVSYETWLKRLTEANADYLFIDINTDISGYCNKKQELFWAETHPERFRKLVDDGVRMFYQIKKP